MENINQQPPPPQPSIQNNGEKPSSKYKILGIINIIFGFLQIPVPMGLIFFVIPQLTNLYQGLNIKQPNLLPTYLILIFLMTLGTINIIIGVKLLLKSTQNKEKYFTIGIVAIILIFLSAGSSMAVTITSIVTPIYKLTSELDSSPSPTIFQNPSPTPTINTFDTSTWKTYTNSTYGFSIIYPSKGEIAPGLPREGECGNAIKEEADEILFDNFFSINIKDWQGTIQEYINSLKKSGPSGPLEARSDVQFVEITDSGADEAIEIKSSGGYMYIVSIISIYKKSNKLFILRRFQNAGNFGGCENPDRKWDIPKAFKFTH